MNSIKIIFCDTFINFGTFQSFNTHKTSKKKKLFNIFLFSCSLFWFFVAILNEMIFLVFFVYMNCLNSFKQTQKPLWFVYFFTSNFFLLVSFVWFLCVSGVEKRSLLYNVYVYCTFVLLMPCKCHVVFLVSANFCSFCKLAFVCGNIVKIKESLWCLVYANTCGFWWFRITHWNCRAISFYFYLHKWLFIGKLIKHWIEFIFRSRYRYDNKSINNITNWNEGLSIFINNNKMARGTNNGIFLIL